MKNEMILSDGTKIKVGDVIEFRVFRTLATVRGFASTLSRSLNEKRNEKHEKHRPESNRPEIH
jgi:hypothetical protein